MKAFRISGRFRMGRAWQPFAKELAAKDEVAAREKLLSILGSQHGVPRKYVAIATVEEVPKEQVEDHAVRYDRVAGSRASANPNFAAASTTLTTTARGASRDPRT